jgi:hypothetical protein
MGLPDMTVQTEIPLLCKRWHVREPSLINGMSPTTGDKQLLIGHKKSSKQTTSF